MKELKVSLVVTLLLAVSLVSLSASTSRNHSSAFGPPDDIFGMAYDTNYGGRTGYLPSGTAGLQMTFSISTSHTSCTSSSGWVGVVDSLLIAGGSPQLAWLQASLALGCTGSGTSQWNIQYGYIDNNGGSHFGNPALGTLSTSTYPTLTGTISIYYDSNLRLWTDKTYVSQVQTTYIKSYPTTIQGTSASSQHDDWSAVETSPSQAGITLSSGFLWTVTAPQFYISSSWQNYNHLVGSDEYIYAYYIWLPSTQSTNKIAVLETGSGSTGGIKAYYYGASPPNNNGNLFDWLVFHCCLPGP